MQGHILIDRGNDCGGRSVWQISPTACRELLDGDRRARGLELVLASSAASLATFSSSGGGGVDKVLGLLETQAGDDLADNLDDADLLLTGGLEDDVELRLLLAGLGGGRGGCTRRGRDGDRSGRGDLEGLLERLDELRQPNSVNSLNASSSSSVDSFAILWSFPDLSSGLVGSLEEASTQLPQWPSLAARRPDGRTAMRER